MKLLDFPLLRQSTNYTCGCVALQGVLCYYGIEKREGELAKMMGVSAGLEELRPEVFCKVAKEFGLRAEYRKLTLGDLFNYIDSKIPVICNFQAWTDGSKDAWKKDLHGHYATVIGYDRSNKWLIFSDPSSFYRSYLPYEEFILKWHDGEKSAEDYRNAGIVISGKPVKWDSHRLVKIS